MQWNCPHCGISLAVSSDTLGTGWSFSRCYKCGGFALIRKTEINVIKVDKAPPGENIILPEGFSDPTAGLLSKNAIENLMKHTEGKQVQPPPPPFLSSAPAQTVPVPPEFKKAVTAKEVQEAVQPVLQTVFPKPLPEVPRRFSNKIPVGLAVSSIMVIVSGYYLFNEGRVLWRKAPDLARLERPIKKVNQIAPKEENEIVDHVQQSAMAPVQVKDPRPELSAVESGVNPAKIKEAISTAIKNEEKKEFLPQQTFLVKMRGKKASIYSGPGMEFPVVGSLSSEYSYIVIDWNNRWLKVLLKSQNPTSNSGWVRNDYVQVLSEMPNSRIASPNIDPLRQQMESGRL